MIRQIEFLKAENQILRSRVPKKFIVLKPDEKSRLMKLGQSIGSDLKHIISIVNYGTYLRWLRKARGGHAPKKLGRPRTAESIRQLIVKIASETGWGYTRIMGELKKLGLKPPSRSTVKNIFKEHGFNPGPRQGEGSWSEFLQMHAETLYQCDFFSKNIWTSTGLRQFFVLVFLHIGSRKVFVTKCSRKPDSAWMKRQADNFLNHVQSDDKQPTLLMRDRDSLYRPDFDQTFRDAGIRVKKNSFCSPNLQAHIERYIHSMQQECLDHFIVCGEKHFDFLISEYVDYYHTERPHQSLGNEPLTGENPEPAEQPPPESEIIFRTRLGGLIKSYHRAA